MVGRPRTVHEGALHDEMREDPRASAERAAARAAELFGDGVDAFLEEDRDRFWIDPAVIPEGWSYEWKTEQVYGKDDPARMVGYARTGWEPVPASRHPEMMPKGAKGPVRQDGMVLMERPKVVTDRSNERALVRARGQMRDKMNQIGQTPAGQMERRVITHKTTYEAPIAVPE